MESIGTMTAATSTFDSITEALAAPMPLLAPCGDPAGRCRQGSGKAGTHLGRADPPASGAAGHPPDRGGLAGR